MRYAPGHKQASRKRILRAAAELFRRQGILATGVDSVMAAAGLTAGGFYSHFRSKEALVAAAVDTAGEAAAERWFVPLATRRGSAWSHAFLSSYLSEEHRDDRRSGCLVPSLAADVARAGPAPRRHFERRLRGFFDVVAAQVGAVTAEERKRALGAVALCVGGVLLSRVVLDRKLSGEILAASRASAEHLLEPLGERQAQRKET